MKAPSSSPRFTIWPSLPRTLGRIVPLAGCLIASAITPLSGAVLTWVPTFSDWSQPQAWVGRPTPPIEGDDLVFTTGSGSSNHDLADHFRIRNLTFDADSGAYTLTGNALTLGGNISHLGSTLQTIGNDLVLNAARTVTVSQSAAELHLSGDLSGGFILSKTGFGTLSLSGANTHTGTTLYAGELLLDYSRLTTPSTSILQNSHQIVGGNSRISIKGSNSGNTLQSIASLNLFAGTLVKIGIDDNGGAGTRLHVGTLGQTNVTNLGIGNLHFDATKGGTLTFGTSPALANNILARATVRDNDGIGFATVADVSGLSTLTRYQESAMTTLPGGDGTMSASVNYITSGHTTRDAATAFQSLTINGSTEAGSLSLTSGFTTSAASGILKYGSHDYTISGSPWVSGGNHEIAFHVFDTGTLNIASDIRTSHNVKLTKTGDGRLIFSGTNNQSLAGSTVLSINEGVVQLDGNTPFYIYVNVDDGLQFGPNTRDVTIRALAHTSTIPAGRVKLENINGESVALTLGSAASNWSGVLYGSGSLIVEGGQTQTFSASNTFTGGTTVRNNGILVLKGFNALNTSGDITVDGGQLGNLNENLNQTLTGRIQLISGSIVSHAAGGGTLTKTGGNFEMESGTVGYLTMAGTGGLLKTTAGTVTLNIRQGTYSGDTLIQAGTLLVNSTLTQSAITVSAGATLGGNGSVTRISGAGTVAPGNSPGMLTAPDVDPTAGLDFSFEFTRAATSGTSAPNFADLANIGNDVLRLTATTPFTASLTSANVIAVDFTGLTLAIGEVYLGGFFAENDFADALANATFQFIGADDFTFSVSTLAHTAAFAGGPVDGYITAFEVEAIPEPGTVALLFGSGIFLLGAWRRKQAHR